MAARKKAFLVSQFLERVPYLALERYQGLRSCAGGSSQSRSPLGATLAIFMHSK